MQLVHNVPDMLSGRGMLEFLEPVSRIHGLLLREVYLLDQCEDHIRWVKGRLHPRATVAESVLLDIKRARDAYLARAPAVGLTCKVDQFSIYSPAVDVPRAYRLTLTIGRLIRASHSVRMDAGHTAETEEEILAVATYLCRPKYESIWQDARLM